MGGVEQTKERHREARSLPLLEDLRRDLGIAARMLMKARGFTAVVILTLGAGIGGNTAMFTVVNALLLRPLPYPQSEQLVRIVEHIPAEEARDRRPERRTALTKPDAEALAESTTISDVGLYSGVGSTVTWTEGDEVRALNTAQLQPSMFPTLRLSPVLGRVFGDADTRPGATAVAILSWSAWHQYFGGDPSIAGRAVNLSGREHAIVGVMPDAFAFPSAATEVWTPLVPLSAPPSAPPLPYTRSRGSGTACRSRRPRRRSARSMPVSDEAKDPAAGPGSRWFPSGRNRPPRSALRCGSSWSPSAWCS